MLSVATNTLFSSSRKHWKKSLALAKQNKTKMNWKQSSTKIPPCSIISNKALKSKLKWDSYVVLVMRVVNKPVVGRTASAPVFRATTSPRSHFCCNAPCWYGADEDNFAWVDSCLLTLAAYWSGTEEAREMALNLETIPESLSYLSE